MGSASLAGMLEVATIDQALLWHLQHNHYPPLPTAMVAVCKRAIAKARAGDWDGKVNMKDAGGIHMRGFPVTRTPVWKLIESAHLDQFVEVQGDS